MLCGQLRSQADKGTSVARDGHVANPQDVVVELWAEVGLGPRFSTYYREWGEQQPALGSRKKQGLDGCPRGASFGRSASKRMRQRCRSLSRPTWFLAGASWNGVVL